MKIALAQINPTVGDFEGNTRKILAFAQRAADTGADLVLLPELAVCGYWPADLLEKASFLAQSEAALAEVCRWTAAPGRPALLVGAALPIPPDTEGKSVRNVAALLEAGEQRLLQQKTLLPFYDVFDEQRYFEPAATQHLVAVKNQTLAITVCEDAWNDKGFWPRRRYAVDPVERLMQSWPETSPEAGKQTRIILNISASPFWQGKRAVRRDMLGALAREHRAFVAMCNQVGGNDSLIFDGSSLALNPQGEVIAQAASFAEDLILFDTDANTTVVPPEDGNDTEATWQALTLGIRDYVRKCGFSKVLIGLSGGIDSALVAALAVDALGPENVTGIGMPSEYSSPGSRDDAHDLANRLGIRFEILPVAPAYTTAMATLAPLFTGTPFGLAEENLQSRLRGLYLMALSNKFGALVLTTGNKSEMSVGYCTLYGDMVGALAVIGDVWKTEVYKLSIFANRHREVIPTSTLTKPPSAELRPGQMDTDSLPPYEILDPILISYVEQYCAAAEIAHSQHVDLSLVRDVLKLVERSEYKRQQAAPVLKVTRKSFGMGRRFPIAVKVEI